MARLNESIQKLEERNQDYRADQHEEGGRADERAYDDERKEDQGSNYRLFKRPAFGHC
jgi:hypothetical protein